jgi:prolyl oligopeptidase
VIMRIPMILVVLFSSAVAAAPVSIPPAPTTPFHETVFGTSIDDPYRWMEDPAKDAELVTWIKAASVVSTAQLNALPERPQLAETLDRAMRAGVRYSDLQSVGALLFFREQKPADRVPKLVVREAGHDRVLFDPEAGQAGVSAISNYSVSPDGMTVAVHVAKGGGEVGEMHFVDVSTGKESGVPLGPIWGEMQVAWLSSSVIAYTRMAETSKGDPTQGMRTAVLTAGAAGPGTFVLGPGVEHSPHIDAVEFPFIGTSIVSDVVIGLGVGARADARVFVAEKASVAAAHPSWQTVAEYDDRVSHPAALGDYIYVISTRNAPNGEVLRRAVTATSLGKPEIVLPGSGLVLTDMTTARDGVYVQAQRDGIAHVLFLPHGSGPAREVKLPIDGDLSDLTTDLDGKSVTFGMNGWFTNTAFYRVAAGIVEPVGLTSDSWDGSIGASVVRDEATSADGTRVPMVIELPAGGKGAGLPMILEGYGSYGINNIAPWYNPPALAWIAHGGAYAFCGTRGGNERGRSWHEDGREMNKPKAHADFIACAEELEAKGYTSPAMLVATGTSAGGTLAPPAVLKRPDLFAGLVSRVAMVNATRLAAAENGANQFAEFGNPATKAGFSALTGEDAYLMLDTAKDIPDTLVTVGLNDRRVSPWMGGKFAAKAAAKFGGHRTILVRADAEGGHGIGSARDRLVAEWADTLAFAWRCTHRR